MKKKTPIQWLMIVVMLIGAGAILYPLASQLATRYQQQSVIREYNQQFKKNKAAQQEKVKKYNKAVVEQTRPQLVDPYSHPENQAQANAAGAYDLYSGMLGETVGTIRVPKIDVKLPIYFGTNDKQLEEGAGVMPSTSLPYGGKGTHSVITAHSGLQKARMFTDLQELRLGDKFFIDQPDETLAYKVDQIVKILPDDFSYFDVDLDQDYVTLLTCTPIGENTHRLLVRGHRVPYSKKDEQTKKEEKAKQAVRTYQPLLTLLAVLLGLMILSWFIKQYRKKKAKKV